MNTPTSQPLNASRCAGSVLTPVPRLLTAGHWSFSPVAVLTGKLAAEHVFKNTLSR